VPGNLLRQPFIELQATAQRLRVSNRADRRLTLSGNVSAKLAGRELQLRGQLKADSALFILPDERAPSLDADVVVRSTRTLPTEASDAQRVLPDVSIRLDLGPQFEVRGQGIQTRLEGQLTVLATPALPTPRVLGEVRTTSGTYRAYGQQLNIENGVMRFTGPYDDPALDIRAMRKLPENTEQRVGVVITGNAQAPRVGLFAEPDLPDGDKLAWLVLGRPASSAGAQAFVLQQAARRLLARGGEPLDSALAKTLGLDEIGFSSTGTSTNADGTTTTDAALTLGKRLSSDLYLSYEQSVTGAMSTVSILYDLSKRLTLRARAGTENAVDLIFTHRYD
jgi:translocation and assembly module TamB